MDFDLRWECFWNAAEDIDAAASAGALDGIFGFGNFAEFFVDEADDNVPSRNIGFDEICDATIDTTLFVARGGCRWFFVLVKRTRE